MKKLLVVLGVLGLTLGLSAHVAATGNHNEDKKPRGHHHNCDKNNKSDKYPKPKKCEVPCEHQEDKCKPEEVPTPQPAPTPVPVPAPAPQPTAPPVAETLPAPVTVVVPSESINDVGGGK